MEFGWKVFWFGIFLVIFKVFIYLFVRKIEKFLKNILLIVIINVFVYIIGNGGSEKVD